MEKSSSEEGPKPETGNEVTVITDVKAEDEDSEDEEEEKTKEQKIREMLVWLYFFTNHTNNTIAGEDEGYLHQCEKCGENTLFDSQIRYNVFVQQHAGQLYFSKCLSNHCLKEIVDKFENYNL